MASIYDLTDSWNDAGATFSAIKMNVTDTASQEGSMLLDLQVGGVSKFAVRKDGVATVPARQLVSVLAATGASQADAAPVTTSWTRVASGLGLGIRLPPLKAGDEYHVAVEVAYAYVYPAAGERFLGLAVNGQQVVHQNNTFVVRCRTAGIGERQYVSNSNNASGNVVSLLGGATTPTLAHDMTTGQMTFYGAGMNFTNPGTTFALSGPSGTIQTLVSDAAGTLRTLNRGLEGFRVTGVASAVNSIEVANAVTGSPVEIKSRGSEANVDLALTPQGTGLLRFGAYQAGVGAAEGYIRIKAADGTVYRLLARSDT